MQNTRFDKCTLHLHARPTMECCIILIMIPINSGAPKIINYQIESAQLLRLTGGSTGVDAPCPIFSLLASSFLYSCCCVDVSVLWLTVAERTHHSTKFSLHNFLRWLPSHRIPVTSEELNELFQNI